MPGWSLAVQHSHWAVALAWPQFSAAPRLVVPAEVDLFALVVVHALPVSVPLRASRFARILVAAPPVLASQLWILHEAAALSFVFYPRMVYASRLQRLLASQS